ncbi:hypothetical protein JTE90_027567 [Oedothorax gibbosus]|uniref:Transcriptional repressor p66 coiled-coil MBD2-interaction domain-containing protein n=1 Tax=Oedothorax gibbosus TaxID=931172 RepID=A0AAV6VK51_9ARAC|nr:hypothetical protein JTE90_027567 [Oedothorax gibbosus]
MTRNISYKISKKPRMPKEWTGPSEYFAAGLYGGQSRKAIFRSVLTPDGHSRGFNAREFEEAAADLSLKKSKSSSYESREKVYPAPTYGGHDESMDLSTKWRPSAERTTKPPSSAHSSDGSTKRSKHHSRMLPRKRLHCEQTPRLQEIRTNPGTSPDLIVLSDEEHHKNTLRVNGHSATNGYPHSPSPPEDPSEVLELPPLPVEKKWRPEELREKRKLLRELRDELRSEEMKLVLLKKLHQSQMVKENIMNAAVASKIVPAAAAAAAAAGRSSGAAPPPLVRSGQGQLLNKTRALELSNQLSMMNSPLLSNQNSHGGPPPLIGQRGSNSTSSSSSNLMSSLMRSSHNSSSRAPVTTPPNMVMGYNLHNLQQSNQHQISSMNQANPQSCPSPSLQSSQLDTQTPAQRQAAAKLALRKQLEKTLLQIPPPKPPPPEVHFVPNANNQEFICLLGLEKAVDLITEDPSVGRPPPQPFECVQCGTDFSPVWKWQQDVSARRSHKPSVICETCVTSNIKKALKAEHTNRLKTAFVKALQQEQEIEQRMAQLPSPPPPSPPIQAPQLQQHRSTPTPPAPRSPPSKMAAPASLLQHLPKLSAAHQSLLQAQAQQLQHFAQTMQQQPQPAHMYPFAPLLAAQAYSYQMLGKNPLSSAELQRQYLLDMIPPRSLPQGSINWKT